MSYSYCTIDCEAPQNKPLGALAGAAIGAVVGALCLAAASTYTSTLYTPAATAVTRPVVAATLPVNGQIAQPRSFAGAQYATSQGASYQAQETVVQAQGTAVYGWAFVMFAAVAGAVNGLVLWNSNKKVAMAATTGRREALMAGAAAAGMAAGPAFAAYGDAANIFGKSIAGVEQFFDVKGEGWSAKIPGKYNPSKERETPGLVARWEDNFDAVNNASIIVRNVGKNSVTELGSIDDVRNNIVTPLLGVQAFEGATISEGGFAAGRVSAAAILDQKQVTKDGKTYYQYDLLTRTADGNEGGRHQLFSVAASNGKLIVFKHCAGDKRWFKGLEKPIRASIDSFRVA